MMWDHYLALRMIIQVMTLGFAMSNCCLLIWTTILLKRVLGNSQSGM